MKGKRALITGGTTGIGRATAMMLAAEGCTVLICGTEESHLSDALDDLRKAGSPATGAIADIATDSGVEELFHTVDEQLGGLDFAILNAGLGAKGDFREMTHEDCRKLVDTNLTGYILCALESCRRMSGGGGHIVMTGSMSALVHEEGSAVYVATKAGIQGFAMSLRKEVNAIGIKVSLIEPGSVGTDMVDESPQQQREKTAAGLMLKAGDVARAIHFMLSQPEWCDVVHMQLRPHLQTI